jgi:hypothetical protein
MKVTIDTKEDSFEDIKKVLQVLNHVIENKENVPEPVTNEQANEGFMNMFGEQPKETPIEDKAPNFDSFMNLVEKKEEEEKEEPKLQFF